jgi:hypothetical protein
LQTSNYHSSIEDGCLTGRTVYLKPNLKLEDPQGHVILDLQSIEDTDLRVKLINIARGLDDIIPPPQTSGESEEPTPQPKKRKPRTIESEILQDES